MKRLQAWWQAWRSRREKIPSLSSEEWNRRFAERISDPPPAVMRYAKPQPSQPPKPEGRMATPEETAALIDAIARQMEENPYVLPFIRCWSSEEDIPKVPKPKRPLN